MAHLPSGECFNHQTSVLVFPEITRAAQTQMQFRRAQMAYVADASRQPAAGLSGETSVEDFEMNEWISVNYLLPASGQEVETKIDDSKGCRNVATLKFKSNLWWFPDMSMYVYYAPTHWRPIQ